MKLLPRLFAPRFQGIFDPTSKRQLARFLARFGVTKTSSQRQQGRTHILTAYASRPDLREAFPLGLTPHQREAFAAWLFERGRPDLGLADDEIIDYLLAAADDSTHGLRETWLLTPEWQRTIPEPFSKAGWLAFKTALAKRYGIASPWLRRAKLPSLPPRSSWGVNILGHFRYPSGLQEEAVQYATAILAHGGGVSLRDAPVGFSRVSVEEDLLGAEIYDITLAKLGVCESLDAQYLLTGWYPRPGVYRVACTSWELEALPRELAGSCELADEIWTPSEFCARALRGAFPNKTVTAMLPAVSLPKFEPLPRSHFGLPSDRFLFFFAFDIGSVMERKNPLGLIEAFRRAFRGDDRVHLAIKVTRGQSRPADFARLKAAANEASATVLDCVMPREELAALLNCCDAYVSLHRAEGFGYTIAEAMLLGKPTIATGYSANLEFMTPATAYAVEHRLVPVGEGHEPYPATARWAEPDLDHATAGLRHIFEHREEAREVGQRARQQLSALLSPDAAGRRMLERLSVIRKTHRS